MPRRIVLATADDDRWGSVATLLQLDEAVERVDHARTRGEAVLAVTLQQPDVVLLDLALPGDGAVQAARLIAGGQSRFAVALLADSEDAVAAHARTAAGAIRFGARGYIARDGPPDDLLDAVRELAADGVAVTPAFARDLLRALFHAGASADTPGLGADDRLILGLRGRGWSLARVAVRMALPMEAVRASLRAALDAFRAEQDEPPEMLGSPVPRRPLPPWPALSATADWPREPAVPPSPLDRAQLETTDDPDGGHT